MTKVKVSEILTRALKRLGPNGEYWNNYRLRDENTYCALGAIQMEVNGCVSTSRDNHYPAAQTLMRALPPNYSSIPSWNDSTPRKHFPKIKAGFCKAIKLALEEEAGDV